MKNEQQKTFWQWLMSCFTPETKVEKTKKRATEIIDKFVELIDLFNIIKKPFDRELFSKQIGPQSMVYVDTECRQYMLIENSNSFIASSKVIQFHWQDVGGGVYRVWVVAEECFSPSYFQQSHSN